MVGWVEGDDFRPIPNIFSITSRDASLGRLSYPGIVEWTSVGVTRLSVDEIMDGNVRYTHTGFAFIACD